VHEVHKASKPHIYKNTSSKPQIGTKTMKSLQTKTKIAVQLLIAGVCSLSLPFTQIAQAREVQSLCSSQESTFVGAETQNFFVSICGSESPLTYVGLDKKTGKTIRLPLTVDGSENRGRYFEAVNGEYTYSVTVVSRTNKNLTVRKNNRVILREAIIRNIYTGAY
jgi:hypothetical protein